MIVSLHHQSETNQLIAKLGATVLIPLNVMKANKISISDFTFKFAGYGRYEVTYTSPVTGKQWSITTSNMPLIDVTKNSEEPKVKDLESLKRICKG